MTPYKRVVSILQLRLGLSEKTANQVAHVCEVYAGRGSDLLGDIIAQSQYDQWSEDTINNHLADLADEIGHSELCDCDICGMKKRIESIISEAGPSAEADAHSNFGLF